MLNKKRIAVIIPAYNEEQSLPHVIKDIPSFIDRIIVIDNGSTDKTYSMAKKLNVEVYKEHIRGYGSACLKGIAELKKEDIVVFLDADYSDDPKGIRKIVDPILEVESDIVISNRFNDQLEKGAMTPIQRFGNKLAVFLIKIFWQFQYYDLGPLRAIARESLELLHMQDKNFGWTIEMQIKAVQNKFKITQVNVPYRNRIGQSKISGTVSGVIQAGWKIIYKIFYFKWKELF